MTAPEDHQWSGYSLDNAFVLRGPEAFSDEFVRAFHTHWETIVNRDDLVIVVRQDGWDNAAFNIIWVFLPHE